MLNVEPSSQLAKTNIEIQNTNILSGLCFRVIREVLTDVSEKQELMLPSSG